MIGPTYLGYHMGEKEMNKSESKYFKTAVKMDLALVALLKKKEMEYITVRELCETAGVNRSTFYLHYETIGDLLDETVRYLLDSFLSYFTDDTKSIAVSLGECDLSELNFISDKYLVPYLSYIRDNKDVFATAVRHTCTLGFDEVYERMFENIFNPILERFHYPKADRKYVMLYYLNGIQAINTQWLREGCEMPIAEIARIITECIFGRDT